MPRAPKSSRTGSLSSEAIVVWGALLDRMEAFLLMAPWQWINGSSILGVRDAQSGDIDWCSIMGQGGETFGVAIYPGDAGLASLQRIWQDGPDEFDASIQQRALVITFNDRDMITKDMAVVLKACGRRYRGPNAWPELVEHDPGYYPMPPEDLGLLRRTTTTIACLLAMCAESAVEPGLDQHDAQGRPWVAQPCDGITTVRRESMPIIPVPPLPVIPINEVAVARACTKPHRANTAIILDWFVGGVVIDGPEAEGRPYYMTHVVAFDSQTGMILEMEMGRFATVWQDTAKLMIKICEAIGVPAQVILRRAEALTILGPLAEALGTTLSHRPEAVEAIRHFRDQMQAFGR